MIPWAVGQRILLGCLLMHVVACVRAGAVSCDDGTICPEGDRCDLIHQQCVSAEQTQVCIETTGLIDGDACQAGEFHGICDQGVCISGCGDGVQLAEECDDGNFKSHDGCSSRCTLEAPTWERWQSPWTPRTLHAAAYHQLARKLVLVGGTNQVEIFSNVWARDDQGRWKHTADVPGLGGRFGASLAYDEQRGKIVLFGGSADAIGAAALDETWEYDGSTWTKLPALPQVPEARYDAAMAYVGGGEVVLFGGRNINHEWLSDSWKFDGVSWRRILTPGPPGRFGAAMAWAPFSGAPRAVLVGGYGDNAGPGGYLNDQWEYTSAAGWQNNPASTPSVRRFAAMGFEANRLVLFGGALNMTPLGDTWTYNGAGSWIPQGSPPPRLSPRSGATLSANGAGELYLIGGAGEGPALDDIWAFKASNGWTEVQPPARPERHSFHAMVYDPQRRVAVSVGGFAGGGKIGDTYLFDGVTWQLDPASTPPRQIRASAAYDALRNRIVVLGGITAGNSGTMVFESGSWTPATQPTSTPSARRNPALAFDPATSKIVMFGGREIAPAGATNDDTWVFDTQWSKLTSANGPVASEQAGIVLDEAKRRVVLYDQAGTTWSYANGTWTVLVPNDPAGPGPRVGPGLAYSRDLGTIVLYGGLSATSVERDLWRLGETGWTKIEIVGALPQPRNDVHLIEFPPLRGLVLHGGRTVSDQNLDDTWVFNYQSTTPDEDCEVAGDEDGDKRFDADDPDCQ